MKEKPDGEREDIVQEGLSEEVLGKLQKAYQAAGRAAGDACPAPERVIAYALAKLPQEEKARVHAHVAVCRECLGLVLDTRSAWAEAREQKEEAAAAPVQGRADLRTRAAELLSKVRDQLSGLGRMPKLVPAAVAAALAGIIIGLSIYHSTTAPLSIQLNIIAQSPDGLLTRGGPEKKGVMVPEGGSLKTGDTFRITFALDRDAYVYTYLHDSAGRLTLLHAGKTAGKERYTLPKARGWFTLDANRGQEKVYVLAASGPLANPDAIMAKVTENNLDEVRKLYPGIAVQAFGFQHE